MTEVTLVKRLLILAFAALLVPGVTACTREKPVVPVPTPTIAIALELQTPASSPTPTSGAATPITQVTPAPFTPGPTETSGPPPAPPTSPPTFTTVPILSATSTPVPTLTVVAAAGPTTYTVQWGDWLNKIAAQFGVTPQAIVAANPGLKPNLIYPGQVLKIPAPGASIPTTTPGASAPTPSPSAPGTYTVQRGDWLYAIARKFGVSVAALQAANPGININLLYPGQVLNIPGGSAPGATPTPSSGAPTTYTVQPGDTLFSIALRFRTTPYALQIKNNLANPNFIYPGQTLIIP